MDLIDREQAIKVADAIWVVTNDKNVAKVWQQLQELPPAEKTGKWIENDNGTYSCSSCQSWIPKEQHYYARFCLYCGARMENENESI